MRRGFMIMGFLIMGFLIMRVARFQGHRTIHEDMVVVATPEA